MLAPHLDALSFPGTFRLGPLRIPIYGLFATAGLIAALGLSQPAARRHGIAPERLWDAGIVAILAAFVLSRVMLVALHFRIFLAVPMLVLTLPSLTYAGMLLTGMVTWVYLRWKGIAVLRALDAWAPCAALLAAFLQLGHFFEGTDGGMPTKLPWGVIAPGDTVLGHTQPVQLYAVIVAVLLAVFLYRRTVLRRSENPVVRSGENAAVRSGENTAARSGENTAARSGENVAGRLSEKAAGWSGTNAAAQSGTNAAQSGMKAGVRPGTNAALALVLGGLAVFLLDLIRQPTPGAESLPLDPSQMVALAAIFAGTLLYVLVPARRRAHA